MSIASFRNELTLTVKKDAVAEIAQFLKKNEALDFNFLSDLCGFCGAPSVSRSTRH